MISMKKTRKTSQLDIMEKFVPYLANGDENKRKISILAISALGDTKLALKLAALYPTSGTAAAARAIAVNGTREQQMLAKAALPFLPEFFARGIVVNTRPTEIDWLVVHNHGGISFAIIRASSGGEIDKLFLSNWTAMGQAKITRGAYHEFDPRVDPLSQARLYEKIVFWAGTDFSWRIVMVKSNGPDLVRKLKTFVDSVRAYTGKAVIVRTNELFAKKHLNGFNLRTHLLWLYHDGGSLPVPVRDTEWTLWQNTNNGRIVGVNGPVGFIAYNGGPEELSRLASWAEYESP